MTVANAAAPAVNWRARGEADAPIAHRAITRSIFQYGQGTPGYRVAHAIIEAYGRDMKRLMPGVASVAPSPDRLRLLTQLVADANQTQWMAEFLGAPDDFMVLYRDGFVHALDEIMANWAVTPTKPGTDPDLVAEEERWAVGLGMGELVRHEAVGGPTFVIYQYCISVGILSFKRSSGVKVIPPGSSRVIPGLPYTLVSLLFGWWGIPWGPVWTLQTMGRNLSGGIDVGDAVLAAA
jgi:hypothetical protein